MSDINEPNDLTGLNDSYDRALLDEPEYRSAVDDLLQRIAAGETAAYDRIARRFPRYALPLLDAALHAVPAEARLRQEGEIDSPDLTAAVAAGIAAARRDLGLIGEAVATEDGAPMAVVTTFADARKARGWTLADAARRLRLPSTIALKVERGQIATWPERLVAAVAEAFETGQDGAEALLRATSGSFRVGTAAAYSAEGDPEAKGVTERRQQPLDFEAELARERLTPEQAAYWKKGA